MSKPNPIIETIRSRRSERSFQIGPVDREQLETIVDCGRLAPSAMNEQRWEFVVVTSAPTLERIAELAPDNGPFIAHAGACIVVCCDREHRSAYLDGAAATQNMLLAIHALRLGGCWVQAMEKDYSGPIAELLGIPAGKLLVSMIAVGTPFGDPESRSKRELADVLRWERY